MQKEIEYLSAREWSQEFDALKKQIQLKRAECDLNISEVCLLPSSFCCSFAALPYKELLQNILRISLAELIVNNLLVPVPVPVFNNELLGVLISFLFDNGYVGFSSIIRLNNTWKS